MSGAYVSQDLSRWQTLLQHRPNESFDDSRAFAVKRQVLESRKPEARSRQVMIGHNVYVSDKAEERRTQLQQSGVKGDKTEYTIALSSVHAAWRALPDEQKRPYEERTQIEENCRPVAVALPNPDGASDQSPWGMGTRRFACSGKTCVDFVNSTPVLFLL